MTTAPGPLAKLGAILAGRLAVHDPRQPIGPDDLFPDDEGHAAPRIARFLGRDGAPHLALVLESVEGLPRRLLDLTARHGSSPRLLEFVAAGGLDLAERELEREGAAADGPDRVTLEREELPTRLLSPVDIDAASLEAGTRLVVGFGLTFREHRHETGIARPFAFPKPTAPTGACTPVSAGRDGGAPVALLDYELELGCVPFRDVDLDRLDGVDPAADFGYLVVNDVSAREPIVRNRRAGYAQGKGRPTYLPAGPWLVPGSHFTRDPPSLRRMVLTVAEAKARAGAHGPQTLRQDSRLEDLTLGVRELLALLARRRALTMRGPDGRAWPVSVERDGRRILPAGSLLLTGTPGGTAIRSPRASDKAALLVRSLRHLRRPSSSYRRHLEDHRHAFGFLAPGDRVSGWITGLGRQDWQVQAA
jgi:2-keto-4-pentenoate hydratase/2-oxohepta-3-ene-1,7-dioic acid hydratase in catechol pathway